MCWPVARGPTAPQDMKLRRGEQREGRSSRSEFRGELYAVCESTQQALKELRLATGCMHDNVLQTSLLC